MSQNGHKNNRKFKKCPENKNKNRWGTSKTGNVREVAADLKERLLVRRKSGEDEERERKEGREVGEKIRKKHNNNNSRWREVVVV